MARNQITQRWLSHLQGITEPGPVRPSAVTRLAAAIEALEDRRLLSATVVNPGGPIVISPTPTPPVSVAAKAHGVTLYEKAGQSFNAYLGDLVGAAVPPGFVVSASVNWGDGTHPSAGKVSITATGHINVSGSHAYADGGKYAITVTVTATPGPSGTGVSNPIILLLGDIHSRAFVNSAGGVTLDETAGVRFTATVGTFSYIAPATNLHASISWGDGTTSVGTVTATGVSGIDVINFKVTGGHTYAKAGTYPIVVTVTQSGPPGSLIPVRLITTIDSTAIVGSNLDLDGKITGRLSPAPTAVNVGALYILTDASGNVAPMGPVAATGRIQLPPFFSSGPVTGSLTLTTISASAAGPSGSVTMTLAGPVQKGSAPIPSKLTYIITSGTGAFADAKGTGTIDLLLGPSVLQFTMTIDSA